MTQIARVNKSEVMKEAHRMFKTSVNADENYEATFAELLAWCWAIAKQSLLSYLQTGYANSYITIENA